MNQTHKNSEIRRGRPLSLPGGIVPPQAVELEKAVLGAIMLERDAFDIASEVVNSDCFYLESHKLIFDAFQALARKHLPIDMMTVVQELNSKGQLDQVGGAYAITSLTSRVVSSAHIDTHCKIIFQKYLNREMIRLSTEIQQRAFADEDCFDLLDFAEQSFGELDSNSGSGMIHISKVVMQAIKQVQDWKNAGTDLTGVPSGFPDIDAITRGWQPGDLILIGARPSVGKCLGKGTKVIMFDGSLKKVEDVVVGDLLMGDDSTPRRVLSLARGREMMYKVSQVLGVDYRVNESHILSLMRSRNEGDKKHGEIIDMPLVEYLSRPAKFRNNWKGYKVDIEFEEKPLIIPPYMLGLWLGDGSTGKPEITNPEDEILNYLEGYADGSMTRLRRSPAHQVRCRSMSIVSEKRNTGMPNFVEKLKEIGVFGNKHIPQEYLSNSKRKRLQLLAGLIDTDGYLIPTGGYEITQKDKRLAYQIKFLADSLGFRTNITEKRATIKTRSFVGYYFRLTIYGDIHNIPVKIKRKAWTRDVRSRDHKISGIRIEKEYVDDYYGFVIDGNNRFLLEDCTVTHNTAMALNLVRNAAQNKTTVAVWSLEMKALFLVLRMLAAESKIFLDKLQTGRLSNEEMNALMKQASNTLSNLGVFFDEKSSVSISSIVRKAKKLKKSDNLGLIVIDYLQLVQGDDKKVREQQISKISRDLKNLAQDMNIPIIALSQLSRETGSKGISWDSGPPPSALRESGALEQDADLIGMLWGPSDDDVKQDPSIAKKRRFRVVKHRNGVLGTVEFDFRNEIQLFEAIEEATGFKSGNWKPVSEIKNYYETDREELPF